MIEYDIEMLTTSDGESVCGVITLDEPLRLIRVGEISEMLELCRFLNSKEINSVEEEEAILMETIL